MYRQAVGFSGCEVDLLCAAAALRDCGTWKTWMTSRDAKRGSYLFNIGEPGKKRSAGLQRRRVWASVEQIPCDTRRKNRSKLSADGTGQYTHRLLRSNGRHSEFSSNQLHRQLFCIRLGNHWVIWVYTSSWLTIISHAGHAASAPAGDWSSFWLHLLCIV